MPGALRASARARRAPCAALRQLVDHPAKRRTVRRREGTAHGGSRGTGRAARPGRDNTFRHKDGARSSACTSALGAMGRALVVVRPAESRNSRVCAMSSAVRAKLRLTKSTSNSPASDCRCAPPSQPLLGSARQAPAATAARLCEPFVHEIRLHSLFAAGRLQLGRRRAAPSPAQHDLAARGQLDACVPISWQSMLRPGSRGALCLQRALPA
jgi:hypothetical protein